MAAAARAFRPASGARSRSIIPAMATATRRPTAPPATIMPRRSCTRWTSSASPSAHICGLSLGGVVAIAMHHAAPARCASLILADTFAVHPDGQAIYERSIAGSQDLPRHGRTPASTCCSASRPIQRVRSEVVETMARIDPAAYRIGAEAVWLADQRDRAADIRVPTLVMCGSEDQVTPPALSPRAHRAHPGCALRRDRRRRPPRQPRAAGRVQPRDRGFHRWLRPISSRPCALRAASATARSGTGIRSRWAPRCSMRWSSVPASILPQSRTSSPAASARSASRPSTSAATWCSPRRCPTASPPSPSIANAAHRSSRSISRRRR